MLLVDLQQVSLYVLREEQLDGQSEVSKKYPSRLPSHQLVTLYIHQLILMFISLEYRKGKRPEKRDRIQLVQLPLISAPKQTPGLASFPPQSFLLLLMKLPLYLHWQECMGNSGACIKPPAISADIVHDGGAIFAPLQGGIRQPIVHLLL